MRIRAGVLEDFGAPLHVTEVELAGPGPGEVLVKIRACGVCHTDPGRHHATDARRRADPALHGHEHVRGGDRDAGDRTRQGQSGGAI